MSDRFQDESDDEPAGTPPHPAQAEPTGPIRTQRVRTRNTAWPYPPAIREASGPRKTCFAFVMDRSPRPALEPPLFAELHARFFNESIDVLDQYASSSSTSVPGSDQTPSAQHPAAEGARAILEDDCLAAAHVPLDGETPFPAFLSSLQVSSRTSSASTSSTPRTSSARRKSAPAETKGAAAERGTGPSSLPTSRRVSGVARSRSGTLLGSEHPSAQAEEPCDDGSVDAE